jgi:hypothetical protein
MRDFFVIHSTNSSSERTKFQEKLDESVMLHNQCERRCYRECQLVLLGHAIIASVCKEFYYENYKIFKEANFKFDLGGEY